MNKSNNVLFITNNICRLSCDISSLPVCLSDLIIWVYLLLYGPRPVPSDNRIQPFIIGILYVQFAGTVLALSWHCLGTVQFFAVSLALLMTSEEISVSFDTYINIPLSCNMEDMCVCVCVSSRTSNKLFSTRRHYCY